MLSTATDGVEEEGAAVEEDWSWAARWEGSVSEDWSENCSSWCCCWPCWLWWFVKPFVCGMATTVEAVETLSAAEGRTGREVTGSV